MVPLLASLVLVVAFLVVWTVAFKRLSSLAQRATDAFALIDEQFERREAIAPLLVDSLQQWLEPENDALIDVIVSRASAARARLDAGGNPADLSAISVLSSAEGGFEVALRHLLEVAERYPELQNDEDTVRLIEDTHSVGNRVSFARQAYNDVARVYGACRQAYPYSFVAKGAGFGPLGSLDETPHDVRQPLQV